MLYCFIIELEDFKWNNYYSKEKTYVVHFCEAHHTSLADYLTIQTIHRYGEYGQQNMDHFHSVFNSLFTYYYINLLVNRGFLTLIVHQRSLIPKLKTYQATLPLWNKLSNKHHHATRIVPPKRINIIKLTIFLVGSVFRIKILTHNYIRVTGSMHVFNVPNNVRETGAQQKYCIVTVK